MKTLALFGAGAAQTATLMAISAGQALAQNCQPGAGVGIEQGAECAKPSTVPGELFGNNSIFQRVADALIFITGAIAVIMLIIGGFRYVISQGNASAVEGAKNTILFAIIGIIVAVMAYALVHFVLINIAR